MGITVLIVDDHVLLAEALEDALDQQDGIDVIGAAATLGEALPLVTGHTPDVVLLDHRLPDSDGPAATRRILDACPSCRVLLMSATEAAVVVGGAVRAGIAGFVHKSSGTDALVRALRTVAGGGTVFDAEHLQAALQGGEDRGQQPLTDRELEVLGLLTEGLHIEAIARRLTLSHHTVRNHVRHVLAKLGARSQLEAVATGLRQGLVQPPR